MFENIMNFLKNLVKKEKSKESSDTAKERLHLVLMQDRANVSADFLELMKQEIIEVIKKYIDVDEKEIDVHLTNKSNDDGTVGAPALYANIPIVTIKNEARKVNVQSENEKKEETQTNNCEATNTQKEQIKKDNTETQAKKTQNQNTNTQQNTKNKNKNKKMKNNITKKQVKATVNK